MNHQTVVVYKPTHDSAAAAWMFTQLSRNMARRHGQIKYYMTDNRVFDFDKGMPELKGRKLYLIDVFYPREIMEMLTMLCAKVTMIGHSNNYSDIKDITIHYNPSKCTAEITRDLLFNSAWEPWWLSHVSFMEIKTWKTPTDDTKNFMTAMSSENVSIQLFDKLQVMNSDEQGKFLDVGRKLIEKEKMLVKNRCDFAVEDNFATKFGVFQVLSINSRKHRTKIAKYLSGMDNGSFAVVYYSDYIRTDVLENCPVFNDITLTNQQYCQPKSAKYTGQKWIHRWDIHLYGNPLLMALRKINLGVIARSFGGFGTYCSANFIYYGDIKRILRREKSSAV